MQRSKRRKIKSDKVRKIIRSTRGMHPILAKKARQRQARFDRISWAAFSKAVEEKLTNAKVTNIQHKEPDSR